MRPEGGKFGIKRIGLISTLATVPSAILMSVVYIGLHVGGFVVINYYLTLVSYLKGCGDPILIIIHKIYGLCTKQITYL